VRAVPGRGVLWESASEADWAVHKAGRVAPRKVDGSGAALATSGSVQPRPTKSGDMYSSEEKPGDDANTVCEWSSSGMFEYPMFKTDDGKIYELSKKDVFVSLMSR